ncbi:MAG: FAD-dependent thymidylate synthase [Thermodesulfobacteria bacterium]|nr:FAD-dependent thymidylate synthase [Thermodesulfobacteriota bacterium]
MFSLKDHQEDFLKRARGFFDALLAGDKALFRDTLFLSFLGARICYASTPPLELFAEERFRKPEELKAFLMRLKSSGHTSIFAHSPLVVRRRFSSEEVASLAPALFKAWWNEDRSALCLNLRHFAEVYEKEAFEEIITEAISASKEWQNFRAFHLRVEDGKPALVRETTLGELAEERSSPYEGLFAQPEVYVVDVAPERTTPFGWLAVVVEGFSRLFSHQFVRHTWLNFNQRSHRYTQVDQFVCPPSFDEEARKKYASQIKSGLDLYQELCKRGIKKEDARFVTPQGAATTILATGPYFVWEDFVAKRRHLKAQWEIRQLAQAVELVLSRLNP